MSECIECKYRNPCEQLNYLDVANTCTDLRMFVDEIRADAIEEFCKQYKNFQSDEDICDLQEDCSISGGWCIDCFKDKWLKEQNN